MSKLVNDLNKLNTVRQNEPSIIVDENTEAAEHTREIRDRKGIYFLSVLVVLLILLSAVLIAASFKIFGQLEKTGMDANNVMESISVHENEIRDLKNFAARIESKQDEQKSEIEKVNDSLKEGELKLSDAKAGQKIFKNKMDESISELEFLDNSLINQYKKLDEQNNKLKVQVEGLKEQVEELRESSSIFLNLN